MPKDKKVAVVLAAGSSRRFGPENKLELPFDRLSMIEKTVQTLNQTNLDEIFVVVGYQEDLIKGLLKNYQVTFVKNPKYLEGKGTSIQSGIKAASNRAGAGLIVLGDMPFVKSETIDLLLREFQRLKKKKIFVPVFKGKYGNPVLWDKDLFFELMHLTGDNGGKGLMKKFSSCLAKVRVSDPGVCMDIDTKRDLDRY